MYIVARDGTILQIGTEKGKSGYYQVQALRYNSRGGTGLKPLSFDLSADETLFAIITFATRPITKANTPTSSIAPTMEAAPPASAGARQ